MENFEPNIIKNIEAENIEEHQEKLNDEMTSIQLLYADKIYKENYKNNEKRNYFEILESIGSRALRRLEMCVIAESSSGLFTEEARKKVVEKYSKEINEMYNDAQESERSENDIDFLKRKEKIEVLLDYIKRTENQSKENFPEEWKKIKERAENNDKEKEAGVFKYAVSTVNNNRISDNFAEEIKKMGLSKYDDFLEIHLSPVFSQGKNFNRATIKESFSRLAEIIIEKYPQTRALIAESWLLNHPAVEKFIKFDGVREYPRWNWDQLIDMNGQISKSRVMSLFENNKLPYKELLGYIDVEDFLRQYLPQEKRGKISLKTADNNVAGRIEDMKNKIKNERKEFLSQWDSGKIKDEKSLLTVFDKLEILKEYFKSIGHFEDAVSLLKNNIGKKIQDIEKENQSLMNIFEKDSVAFYDKLDNKKYIEREIEIN